MKKKVTGGKSRAKTIEVHFFSNPRNKHRAYSTAAKDSGICLSFIQIWPKRKPMYD